MAATARSLHHRLTFGVRVIPSPALQYRPQHRILAVWLTNAFSNNPSMKGAARCLSSTSATATKATNLNEGPEGVVKPRPPPSPKLPPGIAGKLFGHAAFLKVGEKSKQSPSYQLSLLRPKWYQECNSKTVLVNLAGNKLCLCSDPAVYREVLVDKQAHFTNSNSFREVFGFLFPHSMIVLEGEDWQRVRRVSQKALNRMNMDAVIGAVVDVMDSGIKHDALGRNGEDVDSFRFLSHLTFDVFHKVMYGMDPQTVTENPNNPHIQLLHNCESLLSGINGRMLSRSVKFIWKLPTKANRDLERNRKYILATGENIAIERRAALKSEKEKLRAAGKESGETRIAQSLLDGLLMSQDEDIMTNEEVSDQIATFFFGAYETTSNTLLFTLHSLADNPAVQGKLREEVKKRFPKGKADIAKATLADLDEIKYLVWTLDESFRLNSTAEAFVRDVIKDVVVGGYELKVGTGVYIDHSSVSRDPQFFGGQTNLNEFDPARYQTYQMDKLNSMPFGFGSRICPGRRIAIAEIKAILALLVSEFEILPPADQAKKLIVNTKLGRTCVDGTGWLRFRKLEN